MVGKDEKGRRVLINTIGPVWDLQRVWLIVAGASTFAAFPEWYATLFSGFYLALLLILVALIVRGVAFEYRGKVDDPRWRAGWDVLIIVGSLLPALLWGVAFANIVRGVPIDANGNYTGTLFTLLNPYGLLGGPDHARAVPHLRGGLRGAQDRSARSGTDARSLAGRIGMVAVVLGAVFLLLDAAGPRQRALGGPRRAHRGRADRAACWPTRGAGGLGIRGSSGRHRRRRGRPCSPRCTRTSCRRRTDPAYSLTIANAAPRRTPLP